MASSRVTGQIGFSVPSPDTEWVTGYCAAQLAIDQANAAGDLPVRLELVPVAESKDPEEARRLARTFAERPTALGVLGPLNSDAALATQEVYHAAGLTQLTSEASSPLLTSRGFDNFFRLVANDEYQGRSLAQVAVHYLHAQRIAVIHDNSGWGRPIAEIFAAEAERLGRPPVSMIGFGEAEQRLEFDQLVARTAAANPDLVYYAVYWNKAHLIAHKLRYLGVAATFLGSDALKPFVFLEVPSLDTVKPYHTLAGVDMRLKPSARAFFEAFALRYSLLLAAPQYAAEAYDCASLLIDAVRQSGSAERGAVLQAVWAQREYTGAIGTFRFDERGDLVTPEISLYQCEDGLRRYIGSVHDLVN